MSLVRRPAAVLLTLALFVPGVALGQEIPPNETPSTDPPPRGSTKRGPIRFGDPPPGAADETAPAKSPELPDKSEPERLIEVLATWPSSEAKQAAIVLAAQPTVAYPLLERKLLERDLDWRTVCGCAATLGKIRDLRALELIQGKLQDRRLYQHSGELLDALIRIDPSGARRRLMRELLHPASAVVIEAGKRLRTRVSAVDVPDLRDVYEIGGNTARAVTIGLLGVADPEGTRADLVKALRDKNPDVCFSAAQALSHDPSDEARKLLERAAVSPVDRQLAYAFLAIALRQEREGKLLVSDAQVRILLGSRGLKSLNRLNRAVAATLLADAGYYYAIPQIEEKLDTEIPGVLVDTWAGTEFWKDMKVVQPVALRRLQRLTGEYGMRDHQQWWAWWEQNRESFGARRVLVAVPEDGDDLRVTLAGKSAPGDEVTVLASRSSALGAMGRNELAILLLPEDARSLAGIVNASGVLRTKEGITGALDTRGPLLLTVRSGNRERRVGLLPDLLSNEEKSVLTAIGELREKFAWQRYRSAERAVDLESFVRVMAPAFGEDRSPAERDASMAQLIVDTIGSAKSDESNEKALAHLLRLQYLPQAIGPEQTDKLLRVLGARAYSDAVAEGIVRVLASARRDEAHALLVKFLTDKPSPRSAELLAFVLAQASDEQLAEALTSPNSLVRIGGLRAMGPDSMAGSPGAFARELMEDGDPAVRAAAVRSLGRLRVEGARTELEELANGRSQLRTAAIEALGLLGGTASITTITRALADPDVAVRVSAIEAFASCKEPEGYSAIVFVMSADPSPLVREVAERAIMEIGTARAAAELRRLAIDPAQPPGPRARALAGWSQLTSGRASLDLRRLMDDPATEVADVAAIELGMWRDAVAVPRLLDMLAEGREAIKAVQTLEALSLESFAQRDLEILADLYAGWWEIEQSRGPRAWLMDALTLQGIDDPELRTWADGSASRGVVPALLQGLRSEFWYVRRACDLELRKILGKRVGDQMPWSTPGSVLRMREEWEQAWARRARR